MVGATYLREHRTWEDWAMIVLGLVIGLTPWFVAGATNELIALNAVVVGILVLALGVFELVDQQGLGALCGERFAQRRKHAAITTDEQEQGWFGRLHWLVLPNALPARPRNP